ncbi:glycosyltransferase family 2 protein [Singulisphaera acidiphila]|uniref:Glycosyl transferase n=1 Tax=Singulisphaera acidiphila (strain ATCC BAA-1392 / DSM 18658 / VKM B-2454 / MOB10) TaxID=886293 RepID=L0DPB4_SINAD|nr:glycosyltransferase family 2 protein [Singulisphaera acidiphila]AGA30688.1 glycosyl transferase [Singulisphaera acidiphila DSM 18658]
MDDVPAGPAYPEPRRPPLSVVIPVHNGGLDFERCLRRLRESDQADFELIVVDDGSADNSAALAESYGAIVVRHETALGPAAARNLGAHTATASIVFFLDADVAVHRQTLSRAVSRFDADPNLSALFGSYDDAPTHPGVISQFRNLLHHFVHQQGEFVAEARPARTFWTGCGAIRRQDFLDLGGFDPHLYRRPAIEDIEFGYRLTRAGCQVILARDVQATHLKRWSLGSVIKTDIFQRGVPWMLLMKRSGIVETDLNVKNDQKLCVAAAGLMTLAILAAPWRPELLGLVVACLALIVSMNRHFYRFLARRRGWLFAAASLALHYLYYCCCGLSVVIALALWHLSVRRSSEASPQLNPNSGVRRDFAAEVGAGTGTTSPRPRKQKARRLPRWTKR